MCGCMTTSKKSDDYNPMIGIVSVHRSGRNLYLPDENELKRLIEADRVRLKLDQ